MAELAILVAGATGDTGRYTTGLLLKHGHRVKAFVHRADARSDAFAQLGAEVVVGDLLDFAAVRRAMRGVDRAYFCYPVAAGIVQATAYFAQAAVEAKVGAIVNMSQIVARPDAVSHASLNHWVAERVFDRSGVSVTHLRPTMFAEWLTYMAPHTGATGVLRLPFDGGKVALIAAEDQARVIAAILESPSPHAGQTYELFGGAEMTYTEITGEMSAALGRPIRYEAASPEDFAHLARANGRGEFVVQHVAEGMAADFAAGRFAGTNDVVKWIGGREPMSVREFVSLRAAAFAGQGA